MSLTTKKPRCGTILHIVGASGAGKSYKANQSSLAFKKRCIFDLDRGFQHLSRDGDTFCDATDPDEIFSDVRAAIAGDYDCIVFDGFSEFWNGLCSKRATKAKDGKSYVDPGQYTGLNREVSDLLCRVKASGKTLIITQQEKEKKNQKGEVVGWDFDGSQAPFRWADAGKRIVRQKNGSRTEEVTKKRDPKGEAVTEEVKTEE